jgi:hypothetical protein
VNVPDAAFTPVVAVIVPAVRPYVIVSPPKPRTVEEPTVIPPLNVPDAATTPYGSTKFPFVANTATEEEFTPSSDVLLPFPLNAAVVTTPVETPPEPETFTFVKPAPLPMKDPAVSEYATVAEPMFTVKLDAPTEKPLPCTVTVDWNVA